MQDRSVSSPIPSCLLRVLLVLRVVRYGADYLNPGYRKNKGKSAPNAPYALSPNSSPDSRFPIPDSRFP
ncbi:MAG: hypothetical protein F6K38_42280, partial [Moorea sp. SIO3B2]|nr:hypothetical protein [Moorena sp. SIO3B2]